LKLTNDNALLEEKEVIRKKEIVTSLYHYSDLSVKNIAQQVDMPINEVQKITDGLTKSDALQLLVEQGTATVEKIMSVNVVSLDYSKTASDAALLMTTRNLGSVIVTKNDRPFGIVTERDLIRRIGKKDIYFRDILLEHMASRPLITAEMQMTVEEAAQIMLKNKIRRLPIVNAGNKKQVVGIVTVTDLAMFLSHTRRPGLALSILRAISRGRK
jgi:CBS domain-containing protein